MLRLFQSDISQKERDQFFRQGDAAAKRRTAMVLAEKGDVTYAALLGSSTLARQLNQERLRQLFNFIHIDWNSGER